MQNIGIIIEMEENKPKDSVLGAISYLQELSPFILAFVFSSQDSSLGQNLAELGVSKVIQLSLEPEQENNPEIKASFLAKALGEYEIKAFFGLTSQQGKDLLPRIASIFDAPLLLDCTAVDLEEKTALTSQYSGKTMAKFKFSGDKFFFGLRPNYHKGRPIAKEPEFIRLAPKDLPKPWLEFTAKTKGELKTADLTEASVILAGGRGLQNRENFQILFDCANELDAGVGASRVAVDEGWVPYSMQVGQTGIKVNPQVYIACGISGSVQHFAGMKTSKTIIAINKDQNAPINSKSDYYFIGDLFELLPLLTNKLKRLKGKNE